MIMVILINKYSYINKNNTYLLRTIPTLQKYKNAKAIGLFYYICAAKIVFRFILQNDEIQEPYNISLKV